MNIIEKYRSENGLSCAALGEKLGVSKATISRHRRGFPIGGETALLYAKKLGIPVETLRPDIFESSGEPDLPEPSPPLSASPAESLGPVGNAGAVDGGRRWQT
jgi:DNA-binding XRE family transcriptional regulator